MSEFYFGLRLDRVHDEGARTHTLRKGGTLLGFVLEHDGVSSVTIVENGVEFETGVEFLEVDDALAAVRLYHGVREMIAGIGA